MLHGARMLTPPNADLLRRLAPTHELLAHGWTKHSLRSARLRGDIVRPRQGWYCVPEVAGLFQRAVRVGGRVTCVSEAERLGLAVRSTPFLHVAVGAHDSRLRRSDDPRRRLADEPDESVIVHWSASPMDGDNFTVPTITALRHLIQCVPLEEVIAAADSALRAGLVTPTEWRMLVEEQPRRLRRFLVRVDARSESLLESIARFRLAAVGIECRLQVTIRRVGRVDLLIGDRLVVELDGWEFHRTREQFEEDRRRDQELARQGFRVIRITYRQLMRDWARCLGAIRACMLRGDHRSPSETS